MSKQDYVENYSGLSGKIPPQIKCKLDELANELSTNYITASFGDKEKANVRWSDILKAPVSNGTLNDDNVKHRNILVIGGGVTHDSYAAVPLGKELIKKIYSTNPQVDPDKVKERYDISRKEMGMDTKPPDFENTLSLLTQWYFQPHELRKIITEFIDYRYPPALFYEIVAHMFKHSFLDVIINFNFDELLDNAVEEELGKENYFHIVSDGDCVPLNDIIIDKRIKIPVYIKPHGTFKHSSSLRFTNRHYFDMPLQIKKLLSALVAGKCNDDKPSDRNDATMTKDNIRVNLICVGFNMESLEFNEILVSCQSQIVG